MDDQVDELTTGWMDERWAIGWRTERMEGWSSFFNKSCVWNWTKTSLPLAVKEDEERGGGGDDDDYDYWQDCTLPPLVLWLLEGEIYHLFMFPEQRQMG